MLHTPATMNYKSHFQYFTDIGDGFFKCFWLFLCNVSKTLRQGRCRTSHTKASLFCVNKKYL